MDSPMVFIFAMEPVAKGRPRMTRSGHAFTPAKTRKAEADMKESAAHQMQGEPPLDGALKTTWHFWFHQPKSNKKKHHTQRGDIDNYIKLQDSLNEVVWVDDCQIVECHAYKHWTPAMGYIELVVEKIDD